MTVPPQAGARWVCCHLGAREHYAVPRALHRVRQLRQLITDAWVKPGSLIARVPGEWPRRLSERFHPDLADAAVRAFTMPLMAREMLWRSRGASGWDGLMARNRWFGRRAATALQELGDARGRQTVVFAHSYSARDVFTVAKARGWTTVLGQIDPGEEHFRIVQRLSDEWKEFGSAPTPPPATYFEAWREECALADHIVVNSEWTREALARAGIATRKLQVVPLTYEPEGDGPVIDREYPTAFTPERPLRALFVGHVAVVKGAAALLEAMARLAGVPVELRMVGATAMAVPPRFLAHPAIRWIGPVSRREVMRHYRECDVLVFPSLSDGFGMAQIEAQGWRLPIVASPFCGQVVVDGINGILLPEVSPDAIASVLRRLAAAPELLAGFARRSGADRAPGLGALSDALLALEAR